MNPGDTSPSFIILFTDLSIILLTFLIFLNALALPDMERRANAIASVGEQFQGTRSVTGPDAKRQDGFAPQIASNPGAMSFSERYGTLANLVATGGFKVETKDEFFLLSINGDQLFTRKDKQVSASSLPFLRELSKELSKESLKIQIAAHSSKEDVRDAPYNDSLLEAAALTRFFLDQGVSGDRLEVRAHGALQPRASQSNKDNITNHRVEILFMERS